MRRCIISVVIILLFISGFVVGCNGTTATDGKLTERDKAVAFYKGAYLISEEIRDVANDWNVFLNTVERGASDEKIVSMCSKCQSRLESLQNDFSLLYAPLPIRELRDNIALCISTGIEGFMLEQQCILRSSMDYCIQGDEKLLELNRLIMVAADQWDDGLAHYKIKPSEIMP